MIVTFLSMLSFEQVGSHLRFFYIDRRVNGIENEVVGRGVKKA